MASIEEIRIPVKLLEPYELTLSSKYLYGLLLWHSYSGKCYCTNKTLASEVGCSIRTIQNSLKELEDKKCISVEIDSKNGVRYITPLVIQKIKLLDERKVKKVSKYDLGNYDVSGGLEEL